MLSVVHPTPIGQAECFRWSAAEHKRGPIQARLRAKLHEPPWFIGASGTRIFSASIPILRRVGARMSPFVSEKVSISEWKERKCLRSQSWWSEMG
jgi:hypothetical protein